LLPLEVSIDSASVSVTEAKLTLLNNALKEVLNGTDIPEFHSRLGVSRETAHELQNQIGSLLDKMKCEA
jgi:hypothetical protein